MDVERKPYWIENHTDYEGFKEKILKRNEIFSFREEIREFRREGNHLFYIELSENKESYVLYCKPLHNSPRTDTEDQYSQLLVGNKQLVIKTAILDNLEEAEMPRIFIKTLGKFELGREEIFNRAVNTLKKMEIVPYLIWKDAIHIDWGDNEVGRDLIGNGDYELTLKTRRF